MSDQPKTWADVTAGKYGIPGDATHFRWRLATAQRQKMCDGGALYDLSSPYDRPGSKPAGAVAIHPYVVTAETKKGGTDKLDPCVIKASVGGSEPVTWVIVEFQQASSGPDDTVKELVGLVKHLTEQVTKPQEILIAENKRLQERCDEQAKYIAENEGGPVSRFLNQNPEVVRDVVKAGLEWGHLIGKGLRFKINQMEAEAKRNGYAGELDVTPTK